MNRNKLTIIKAPPGLGKSRAYIEYALSEEKCSKVVVVPTNNLKDQIYEDAVKKYGTYNFMKTPALPTFKVAEIQEKVENYYKMGLHSAVKKYLYKKKKEIEEKEKITSKEKVDLDNINYYLEQNKLINKFEGNVITTHDRLYYFSKKFLDTHKIIIDEDIIKSTLKITKISMKDLLSFNCKDYELYSKFQNRIMQITDADYEKTTQLIENVVTESKIIKEIEDDVYDFDLMCVFNAKALWKYNPKKEVMENFKNVKDNAKETVLPNSSDEIYFLEVKPFPNYDIVLFSATVEEKFYKMLFWNFDVNVLDVGNVRLLGEIKQFPSTSCSRYDLKIHEDKFKSIRKKYPKIKNKEVISFKQFNSTEEALNFGNTEGKNHLEGKDLLIIGTPHYNEAVYKLYAYAIDKYANDYSNEQMRYQEIEYNNCKFWFNTYDNKLLRDIQLWLINTELEQAVGRARLLRNDCTVYLYSNLPIKQAEFLYEDKKEV